MKILMTVIPAVRHTRGGISENVVIQISPDKHHFDYAAREYEVDLARAE